MSKKILEIETEGSSIYVKDLGTVFEVTKLFKTKNRPPEPIYTIVLSSLEKVLDHIRRELEVELNILMLKKDQKARVLWGVMSIR